MPELIFNHNQLYFFLLDGEILGPMIIPYRSSAEVTSVPMHDRKVVVRRARRLGTEMNQIFVTGLVWILDVEKKTVLGPNDM
jgi:hypothetical protein